MKSRLILVRHAEAEGNYLEVFHGITDSLLTKDGHAQGFKVAQRLRNCTNIDVLYASSAKRAVQTAEYISKSFNICIISRDDLREINGGDWEGQKCRELQIKWPVEYNIWENTPHMHQMPNGENMRSFCKRVVHEVASIIDDNKGKTICIVTHGVAIRVLLCYFTGHGLENMARIAWCDNTAITTVDCNYIENSVLFDIVTIGDSRHLG